MLTQLVPDEGGISARQGVIRRGDLEVNEASGTVLRAGAELRLRRRELALLVVLLQANGRPMTAHELLVRAWGHHGDPSRVRMTLTRLRRGLGNPPLIETVVGAGYRVLPP